MSVHRWSVTFVASGSVLVAALVGLEIHLDADLSRMCWVLGEIALPVCLVAARKMMSAEKVQALAEAAWLKDTHATDWELGPGLDIDVGDD